MKRKTILFLSVICLMLLIAIVTIGYSQREKRIAVPDVIGLSQEAAVSAIESVELYVGMTAERYHDTIPKGQVINQYPDAGILVRHGTVVKLLTATDELSESESIVMLPGEVPLIMVLVPPGSFLMGSPDDELDRYDNEGPQHEVTFSEGFWMSKYPITQVQWETIMGDNPSGFLGDNRPVEQVSCNDIRGSDGYLEKLNEAFPDLNFRLPSEAEWEYAYRAGTTTRFYWGDDLDYSEIDDYAWHPDNNSPWGSKEVGLKLPNAWGLHDMSGNVWEWCEDNWYENYSGAPSDGSAWVDSPRNSFRILRGGSWRDNYPLSCRAASRIGSYPDYKSAYCGFRVVCDLD